MTDRFIFYTRRLLILAICLLFIMFLSADVYGIEFYLTSNIMKFIAIFLCLVISIISSPLQRQSKNIFLLQLGLIFTVMADYIFLIIDNNYILAIGLFSIVQIIYSLRYREGNEKLRIIGFATVFLGIYGLYRLINRYYEIDFLIAISVFYAICLTSSIKEAFWLYRNNSGLYTKRIILLAMILFFLCDVSLGLNYLLGQVRNRSYILNILKAISSISIWTYYLPSQILLALSGSDIIINKD